MHLEGVLRTSCKPSCPAGLTLYFAVFIVGHPLSFSPLSLTSSFSFQPENACRCYSSLKIHYVTDNLVYGLEQIHSYRRFI